MLRRRRLARGEGASSNIGGVDRIRGPAVARRLDMLGIDRVERHLDAAATAHLAGGREGLDEPGADALARHLHETERGDLGNLMLRAVAA